MTVREIMSDDEFVGAFESCELSPDAFHHRDHIRLARIYVDRFGPAEATERFKAGILKFASRIGKSDKYHETITIAWMKLVINTEPAGFEKLFDKNYIEKFYSAQLLESAVARTRFVEPDRSPLPVIEPPTIKTGAEGTRVVK
jgi:hypothetical protein